MDKQDISLNINDTIQELAINFQRKGENWERDLNELCVILMPKLQYFIWRYIKDEHTINDIVSDTLLKMISKIDTFNYSFRFTTWIYRIATNLALGHIDKTNKITEIDISTVTDSIYNEPNYTLENNKFDFDKLYQLTIEAIFKMPNDINKSIIIEKHINDLKGSEIANKFGINENTVKTKLRAMRKRIRTYIKENDAELYGKVKEILYKKID